MILPLLVPPHPQMDELTVKTAQAALDAVGLHQRPSPRVLAALVTYLPLFDQLHGDSALGCHDQCRDRCSLSRYRGLAVVAATCRRTCNMGCLHVDAYESNVVDALEKHAGRLTSADAATVAVARTRLSRRLFSLGKLIDVTVGSVTSGNKVYGSNGFGASESRLFDDRVTLTYVVAC